MAASSALGSANSSNACPESPVPVAGVALVALDLVQHRVQPVGCGVSLVALGDGVRRIPILSEGEVDGAGQLIFAACHASHPLARSTHAGQCPQP